MRQLKTVATLLVLFAGSAVAQGPRDASRAPSGEQAVLAASHKTIEALRQNDAAALEAMLADDYFYVGPRGAVLDKRAQVEALRNGTTHFDALTTSDERVRMFKDAAVVTLIRHQKGRGSAGPLAPEVRVLHVYARRNGRWSLVVSQQTPVQP